MPLKGRNSRSWIVKFFIQEYVLNVYFNTVFCRVYVDLLESSLSLYHAMLQANAGCHFVDFDFLNLKFVFIIVGTRHG